VLAKTIEKVVIVKIMLIYTKNCVKSKQTMRKVYITKNYKKYSQFSYKLKVIISIDIMTEPILGSSSYLICNSSY